VIRQNQTSSHGRNQEEDAGDEDREGNIKKNLNDKI
jgi:hypothetical protein